MDEKWIIYRDVDKMEEKDRKDRKDRSKHRRKRRKKAQKVSTRAEQIKNERLICMEIERKSSKKD